ncbi:MAG: hypothetical protein EBU06_07480, partial [Micrococcales bacterium]|nr:hypothetical protein [Micrococcales bacterium]
LSGGTANGVLYLNGSKVATSGSALVFDGTNLGIGTSSPGLKLDVVGVIRASVASGNSAININNSSLTGKAWDLLPNTSSGESDLLWYYGGASAGTRMTLTNSGNLGLGVTPSASNVPTIEQSVGLFVGRSEMDITSNAYYNSGWKYVGTGEATQYQANSGLHKWFTATSSVSRRR